MGNCFWCYFRQFFIPLAFRKCIKDFHILIIILVQDICPLKTEIARFPIGFCLKLLGTYIHIYPGSQKTIHDVKNVKKRSAVLMPRLP